MALISACQVNAAENRSTFGLCNVGNIPSLYIDACARQPRKCRCLNKVRMQAQGFGGREVAVRGIGNETVEQVMVVRATTTDENALRTLWQSRYRVGDRLQEDCDEYPS